MSKLYVLSVINDSPYHEDVETWVRFTGQEIVECFEDWMSQNEVFFSVCEFNVSGGIDITEQIFEDVNLVNFEKAIKKMKKNAETLPKYPEIDTIYFCNACDIYFLTDTCNKCLKHLSPYE